MSPASVVPGLSAIARRTYQCDRCGAIEFLARQAAVATQVAGTG
jgi:hypothetical protein